VSDHQRRRILAAATEVFAARGYRGTSVEDIVAAAHVGVGSFYAHFTSKEDCLLRAYEEAVAAWRQRIAAAVPAGAPWGEQALAALRALLGLLAAEPAAARLLVLEAQTAGGEALALHERTLDSLPSLLARGRGLNPAARELPESHEVATVGGLAWLLGERLEEPPPAVDALLPELVEIVVAPYLGEAEAARLLGAHASQD
jgi:AcrR family transcriptional regulator